MGEYIANDKTTQEQQDQVNRQLNTIFYFLVINQSIRT